LCISRAPLSCRLDRIAKRRKVDALDNAFATTWTEIAAKLIGLIRSDIRRRSERLIVDHSLAPSCPTGPLPEAARFVADAALEDTDSNQLPPPGQHLDPLLRWGRLVIAGHNSNCSEFRNSRQVHLPN
jgi:hypothetical protein